VLVCVLRVMVLLVPEAIVPKVHVSVAPPDAARGAGEQARRPRRPGSN
jgi:hypothetical protein